MTPEDEAFEEIERRSKAPVRLVIDPYGAAVRNRTIEEVAKAIEQLTAFGPDTLASFAVYIRSMKDE